eukprot:TRINITY_DN5184_c0_g1_i6.p3 TRINITY_DN5184_c0_g1~~TRINITY_DN5184_c0_g1_i6.p3  ORF type:complete len:112 (+),score=40.27 TRINITY_DN5184_c0_g1_i6:1106-1441(+)
MGAHNMGAMHLAISGNEGQWTTNNLQFGTEYFYALENGPWGAGTGEQNGTDLQYRGGPAPGNFVMLPIDMVLRRDNRLRPIIQQFQTDRPAFEHYFTAAWRQIQENGVVFA